MKEELKITLEINIRKLNELIKHNFKNFVKAVRITNYFSMHSYNSFIS